MPIEISPNGPLLASGRGRWKRAAARVALVGSPKRASCCQPCRERAGRLYDRADRRVMCWLVGNGAHPRCRHWLVAAAPEGAQPVGEVANPALQAAARLAREARVGELRRLLARTTRAILGGKAVELDRLSIGLEP